jgi:hypothetical protein
MPNTHDDIVDDLGLGVHKETIAGHDDDVRSRRAKEDRVEPIGSTGFSLERRCNRRVHVCKISDQLQNRNGNR